MVSKEYVKGFNNGYLIRKNNPVLAKTLFEGSTGESEYLQGLKEGSREYEKEWAHQLDQMKKSQSEEKRREDKGMQM